MDETHDRNGHPDTEHHERSPRRSQVYGAEPAEQRAAIQVENARRAERCPCHRRRTFSVWSGLLSSSCSLDTVRSLVHCSPRRSSNRPLIHLAHQLSQLSQLSQPSRLSGNPPSVSLRLDNRHLVRPPHWAAMRQVHSPLPLLRPQSLGSVNQLSDRHQHHRAPLVGPRSPRLDSPRSVRRLPRRVLLESQPLASQHSDRPALASLSNPSNRSNPHRHSPYSEAPVPSRSQLSASQHSDNRHLVRPHLWAVMRRVHSPQRLPRQELPPRVRSLPLPLPRLSLRRPRAHSALSHRPSNNRLALVRPLLILSDSRSNSNRNRMRLLLRRSARRIHSSRLSRPSRRSQPLSPLPL
jgi:hypothetical protein